MTVSFHLRRAHIKLSGRRIYLKPAVSAFKKITSSLFLDELKITEPGAKKYFLGKGSLLLLSRMFRGYGSVVALQDEEDDDNEDEDEDGEMINLHFQTQQWHCKVQMPCRVLIAVCKADICKFQVDAVVCPSNNDL